MQEWVVLSRMQAGYLQRFRFALLYVPKRQCWQVNQWSYVMGEKSGYSIMSTAFLALLIRELKFIVRSIKGSLRTSILLLLE